MKDVVGIMGRKYDLAVFDMDGTLTDYRSSWEFVLNEFGGDNTETYNAWCNMEIDEKEFMRRDLAEWMKAKPGVTEKDVAKILRNLPLVDGIQETVACLHYNGIKCAICSGGLSLAAKMISDEFGFDYYIADDLETDEEGRLTGEGIQNVDLRDKGKAFLDIVEKFETTPERTIAIGNSFGDVPMFEKAGLSIAFNPVDQEYTAAAATHSVSSKNISEILEFVFELQDGV